MTSFAVLAIGIAIVWLVYWAIRNERAQTLDDQTGLFRIRNWTDEKRKAEAAEAEKQQRVSKRSPRAEQAAAQPEASPPGPAAKGSRLRLPRRRTAAGGTPEQAGAQEAERPKRFEPKAAGRGPVGRANPRRPR